MSKNSCTHHHHSDNCSPLCVRVSNGERGAPGVTYTPKVERVTNGIVISWENNGGKPNPQPVTIYDGTGESADLTELIARVDELFDLFGNIPDIKELIDELKDLAESLGLESIEQRLTALENHEHAPCTWGSIVGDIEDQVDLNNKLTSIDISIIDGGIIGG